MWCLMRWFITHGQSSVFLRAYWISHRLWHEYLPWLFQTSTITYFLENIVRVQNYPAITIPSSVQYWGSSPSCSNLEMLANSQTGQYWGCFPSSPSLKYCTGHLVLGTSVQYSALPKFSKFEFSWRGHCSCCCRHRALCRVRTIAALNNIITTITIITTRILTTHPPQKRGRQNKKVYPHPKKSLATHTKGKISKENLTFCSPFKTCTVAMGWSLGDQSS